MTDNWQGLYHDGWKGKTVFCWLNAARDEWQGEAVGLFVGPFCILGVAVWRGRQSEWLAGIVILNAIVGLWNEP